MKKGFRQTVITRGLGRKLKKGAIENMKLATRAFQFHAEIKSFKKGKVGETSGLFIEGYASTKNLDSVGDVVEPNAFEKSLEAYLEIPIVTYMHSWYDPPIGKTLEAKIDDKGLWVKIFISETAGNVIKLIEEGILRALSIGYEVLSEKTVGEINHILELKLYEIAVVSLPANRRCLFSVAKALEKGTDLRCADCKGCAEPAKPEAEIRKEIEAQLRKEAEESEALASVAAAMCSIGECAQQLDEDLTDEEAEEIVEMITPIVEEVAALIES